MKKLLLIITCLVLAGCGFHFRNHQDVPPQLHTLYIQSDDPHGALTSQLTQNLQDVNVNVVSDAQQAPWTLAILSATFGQNGMLLGTAQQVSNITMTYTVVFALRNTVGKTIAGPWTIVTSNTYLQNANQILGDSTMVPSLQQQLVRSTVEQILARLNAKNTRDALQNT